MVVVLLYGNKSLVLPPFSLRVRKELYVEVIRRMTWTAPTPASQLPLPMKLIWMAVHNLRQRQADNLDDARSVVAIG